MHELQNAMIHYNHLPLATAKRVRIITSQQLKKAGVGRNSPCPCGSGRKFKHCCMKRKAMPISEVIKP